MGKGSGESSEKNKACQSKQHLRTVFPKAQLGFKGFSTVYAYLCYFLELWKIELSFQNNFDQSQDKQSTILRKYVHDK